jgi:hypothetical protein
MNTLTPDISLFAAWMGILLGFLSGMVMGMFFHRENWLGGYGSLKRRMYRLAHISFFGLGAVNLFFWLTAINIAVTGSLVALASWAFLAGSIFMPLCCVLMAHFPKARLLFALPVISLMTGGGATLILVSQEFEKPSVVYQPATNNSP